MKRSFKKVLNKEVKHSLLTRQIIISLLIGAFISYIFIVYQPFGTYNFESKTKNLFLAGYGLIVALAYLLPQLIFNPKNGDNNKTIKFYKKAIMFVTFYLLAVAFAFVYYNIYFEWFAFTLEQLAYFFKLGAMIMFPLISIALFIIYKASGENIEEQQDLPVDEQLILSGNNKNEGALVFDRNQVGFIHANGNYIEINYNKEKQKKEVIRNTLDQIKIQLPENFIQTHRSYIVNSEKIEKVFTRDSKYIMQLKNPFAEVPVSRTYRKNIREKTGF